MPAPLPGTVEANVRYGPSMSDDRPAPDVTRCLELGGLDASYAPLARARWVAVERYGASAAERELAARALNDPDLLGDAP